MLSSAGSGTVALRWLMVLKVAWTRSHCKDADWQNLKTDAKGLSDRGEMA